MVGSQAYWLLLFRDSGKVGMMTFPLGVAANLGGLMGAADGAGYALVRLGQAHSAGIAFGAGGCAVLTLLIAIPIAVTVGGLRAPKDEGREPTPNSELKRLWHGVGIWIGLQVPIIIFAVASIAAGLRLLQPVVQSR